MKRIWKVLNTDIGKAMLIWAAESKIGVVVLITSWLGVHLLLFWQISAAQIDPFTPAKGHAHDLFAPVFWPYAIAKTALIGAIDFLIIREIYRETRKKK